VPAGPPGEPVSRLGDADRDRLTGMLREHYALGRLDDAELERRVEIVLSAEHAGQASAALQDLPPLGGGSGPGSRSGPPSPGQDRYRRRHAQSAAPGAAWVPTAERFRDPSSGRIMRVWLDPADDSRHYVPDDGT
jgi:Domain of unknown function (DUF1707)